MIKSTIVGKNENELNQLITSVNNFCEGNFLNALQVFDLSAAEVVCLADDVKICRDILERELHALQAFSKDFVLNYSTDNNECFDTASRLFGKIRRSISGTKKMLSRFTPVDRRCATDTVPYAPVVVRSTLVQPAYTADMFGLSQYDDSVGRLFEELKGFYSTLGQCLLLCRKVLNDERLTRSSDTLSKQAYEYTYNNIIKKAKGFEDYIRPTVKTLPVDEITRRKSAAKSLSDFIRLNYHKHPFNQFRLHVLVDHFAKGEEKGLTALETALWGDDADTVRDIRVVIDDLDSLESCSKRTKVRSTVIVALIVKFTPKQDKLFVEKYLPERYHGKLRMVSYHAVSSAKSKFINRENTKEVNDLMEKMAEMIRTSKSPNTATLLKAN